MAERDNSKQMASGNKPIISIRLRILVPSGMAIVRSCCPLHGREAYRRRAKRGIESRQTDARELDQQLAVFRPTLFSTTGQATWVHDEPRSLLPYRLPCHRKCLSRGSLKRLCLSEAWGLFASRPAAR
jgi:hypothetical protein